MGITEQQPIVFEYHDDSAKPAQVSLTDTGERVATITGTSWIGFDDSGTEFYVKSQPTSRHEHSQLLQLRERGIPVPKIVAFNDERDELATSSAGIPIQRSFASEEDAAPLLFLAGTLLSHVHDVLKIYPVSTEDDFSHTAHIVDNFFYKWCEDGTRVSLDDYREHKEAIRLQLHRGGTLASDLARSDFIGPISESPESLSELVGISNGIARLFLERLAPFVVSKETGQYLNMPDGDICYGDFKPENILATSDGDKDWLRVIDPVLTRGSIYFDLAKFTSRYMLDTAWREQKVSLEAFFDGYGIDALSEEPVYGTFNFAELVAMDMLNILKTYVKRYRTGDKSYRMTAALDDPDFCKFMGDSLKQLTFVGRTALFGLHEEKP